uniref:Uncharacterized protein n=1 Tax=Tanacetum cinerariifolium TaxID=118510 RepID=A0A6L2M114_TANCI|nr:hypothetical protein [Tanacetum cinerariifolium]
MTFVWMFLSFLCHFPLLNPFGDAHVTTFTIAYEAYGREATVPIFRSFLTLGPAGDWLTFQKRHVPNIPAIFGDFMSNIPKWKSEFIFVKQTLISDILPGLIINSHHGHGTFAYPYPMKSFDNTLRNHLWRNPGQTPSYSVRPTDQPVDIGSPSVDHLTIAVDDDQVKSSSFSKHKGASGFELAIVGEGCSGQSAAIMEGSKKMRSITEALEEEATIMRLLSKIRKTKPVILGILLTVPTLLLLVYGEEAHAGHNMLFDLHYPLLRDKLGKTYGAMMPGLGSREGFSTKKSEEVVVLSSKLKDSNLEKARLVRDFFNWSQKLDEVHGLGDSYDFKYVQDYHLEIENIFDEAAEAFYKLKFPCVSLLGEKAGQSLKELAIMEAPSV